MRRKAPARRRARAGAGAAWLDAALVLAAWWVFAASIAQGRLTLAYDAFRDMAYAHGILAGGLGRDPSLPGLPAWYPPGNPLLFAGLSRMTGVPLTTLYGTSLFWLGWLNPLALFWLARASWGRLAGWLALPLVLLGSRWWLVEAAMEMPSVQGVGLALATVLAWKRAQHGGRAAVAVTIALGALTAWVHPLCAAFALGALALHGACAPLLSATPEQRSDDVQLARRALGIAAAASLLALPAVLPTLRGHAVNLAPRHWFGPELHDPRFALHAQAPLVWIPALAGLALAAGDWRREGWLVAWLALAVAGMLAGYAGHDLGWRVPWLIPHEFQWHTQLILMLAASLAISRWAGRLAARPGFQGPGRIGWAVVLLALAVGPALPALPAAGSYVMIVDDHWLGLIGTSERLLSETAPGAVVAAPPGVSYMVSGFTGLRAVALPVGHTNPAVDPLVRSADVESLLTTRDPRRFAALGTQYGVDCLLLPASLAQPPHDAAAALAGWPALEPIALASPGWRAYRVRAWARGEATP